MQRKSFLFFDTIVSKVDAKGRVCIPAQYRALFEQSDTELVAFRSFSKQCVECCSSDLLEKFAADMEKSFAFFSEEQNTLAELIYADAHAFCFDANGRIVLTDKLMKHARLASEVAFVGKGRTFQIWNPELYQKEQENIRQKALKEHPSILLRPQGAFLENKESQNV